MKIKNINSQSSNSQFTLNAQLAAHSIKHSQVRALSFGWSWAMPKPAPLSEYDHAILAVFAGAGFPVRGASLENNLK